MSEGIITRTVASVLNELDVVYRQDENCFSFEMTDKKSSFSIKIVAAEEVEKLVVAAYFPVKIPQANLDRMYKVVNDINYSRCLWGKYVIDATTGELSIRVASSVAGGAVNAEIVKSCLGNIAGSLRDLFDELMKAMYGIA